MSVRAIPIRKHDLAISLQSAVRHPRPKLRLEQYTIPADLAADILFLAYLLGDIQGKTVVDLGTGTGRLALGASMLGAGYVVGIDLDQIALNVAVENCRRLSSKIDWVHGDIETLRGKVDTVLMNPPFGTRQPHADLHFLEVALKLSKVSYSIHKSSTCKFLARWLRRHDAEARTIISTRMEIPHQFSFHRKTKRYVEVDAFRINRI